MWRLSVELIPINGALLVPVVPAAATAKREDVVGALFMVLLLCRYFLSVAIKNLHGKKANRRGVQSPLLVAMLLHHTSLLLLVGRTTKMLWFYLCLVRYSYFQFLVSLGIVSSAFAVAAGVSFPIGCSSIILGCFVGCLRLHGE